MQNKKYYFSKTCLKQAMTALFLWMETTLGKALLGSITGWSI